MVLFFCVPKSWFFSPTACLVSRSCFACFSLALRRRVVCSPFVRGPMVPAPRLSESSSPVVLLMLGCQRPRMKLSRAAGGRRQACVISWSMRVMTGRGRRRKSVSCWGIGGLPPFSIIVRKAGGSCLSDSLCPRASGGSDQGAQQANERWEEGR